MRLNRSVPLYAALMVLLLGALPPARAEGQMEVIPLQHASAEQLLPTVRALLGPDDSASAYNNQLILRASPAKLAEIRLLLQELDVPLRNLMISVRTASEASGSRSGAGISGSVGNEHVRIGTDDGMRRDGARVTVTRRSTQERGDGSQQVRALEGEPAFIATRQDVPQTTQYVDAWGRVQTAVQRQSITTAGIWVTARLQGDQVLLQIRQERGDARDAERVKRAAIGTQLRAGLGEWVPIGGSGATGSSARSGAGHWQTGDAESAQTYIRVDLLDH